MDAGPLGEFIGRHGENGFGAADRCLRYRVDPQIVVGLLVDRHGFPLEIGCFEGNKAETTTVIPMVQAFQARHGLADCLTQP